MLLLLVDPDADGVAARLAPVLSGRSGLSLTQATHGIAARAYLSGAAFDAVAVRDAADAAGLQALVDVLGLSTVVYRYADEAALAAWLAARLGTSAATSAAPVDADAARAALTEVQQELARLTHALNNPLAVVVGNAQLGRELAQATGADEEVTAAFDSVEAAAAALGALFSEIGALRTHLARVLDAGPHSLGSGR